MFKKVLQLTIVAGLMTSTVVGLPIRSSFMNGLSFGLNGGYTSNRIDGGSALNYSSPDVGIHADYNRLITETVFAGAGIEFVYPFQEKKIAGGLNQSAINFKRTMSGALLLRVGKIFYHRSALEINVGIIASNWKLDNKTNPSASDKFLRVGAAPGAAFTFAFSEKISVGAAYRYEYYPKSRGDTLPSPQGFARFNGHRFMVKFNYHL